MLRLSLTKKSFIVLVLIFLLYTVIVNAVPAVTEMDKAVISAVQVRLNGISLKLPLLACKELYMAGIWLPVIAGVIYFYRKYLLIDMLILPTTPVAAYILSHIVKAIVQRPRPPIELQLGFHSASFSYVSTHTLVACTVWGVALYYWIKYCKNRVLKIFGVIFGVFWMSFIAFTRIWLGVHNPTDVIGGALLASVLVFAYIRLIKLIGGK